MLYMAAIESAPERRVENGVIVGDGIRVSGEHLWIETNAHQIQRSRTRRTRTDPLLCQNLGDDTNYREPVDHHA